MSLVSRRTHVLAGAAMAGASVLIPVACGGGAFNTGQGIDAGASDGRGTVGDSPADGGGLDGAADSATADEGLDGPACDPTAAPSVAPCVITESLGVFVSPAGTDSAAGTRTAPMQTINAAMDAAKAKGLSRVYACGGIYSVGVVVSVATNRDGLSLSGGLTCTGWTYDATQKAIVAPSSGYALEVDSLAQGVSVADFGFHGPTPVNPGDSSIAVFANASQNVAFQRVSFVASNGPTGAVSSAFANYNVAPAVGGTATSTTGAVGGMISCLDGMTSSTGGNGASVGTAATDGSAVPSDGTTNGGSSASGSCSDGTGGANGDSNPGGSGTQTTGVLSSLGWTTMPGSDGSDGDPGQGGGGGGAKSLGISGGGGGGAGGCGGGGGFGGRTGGSSICIASFGSTISLLSSTLSAGNGGNGSSGGVGNPGQSGALGGVGACNGGGGGTGAGGCGGGGGAGGSSFGILWSGTTPPTIDSAPVTSQPTVSGITTGTPGMPGPMGTGASPTGTGNPGQNGTAGSGGGAMAVTMQ